MALTLQNDTGTVANANAYVDLPFFKAYHGDRGNAYTGSTDADISAAIVRATDYLDRRFRFTGVRLNLQQSTQWPRLDVVNSDNLLVFGIPIQVKQATAEYALRALAASLAPDPTYDETGARVQVSKSTVGPITEEKTYVAGASHELPRYPLADQLLKTTGLALGGTGGTLSR